MQPLPKNIREKMQKKVLDSWGRKIDKCNNFSLVKNLATFS